jgi:hypothetical protein
MQTIQEERKEFITSAYEEWFFEQYGIKPTGARGEYGTEHMLAILCNSDCEDGHRNCTNPFPSS